MPRKKRGERQRPEARVNAIADHKKFVEREQARQFGLVLLQVVVRLPDVGLLFGRVFQLEDGQRQ